MLMLGVLNPDIKLSNMSQFEIDLASAESSFVISSFEATEGSVFFGIQGENVNGSDFAHEAVERGARLVIVNKDLGLGEKQHVVENVLDFMINIATARRRVMQNKKSKIICITGSVGKTTAKEVTKFILSSLVENVHATQANFNTEIGLSLTILNAPISTKYLILELGCGKIGDMKILAKIANADIAVITNVKHTHIEMYNNERDLIAQEKSNLFDFTRPNCIAIIDREDDYYDFLKTRATDNHLSLQSISTKSDIQNFTIENVATSFEIMDYPFRLKTVVTKNWTSAVLFALNICDALDIKIDFDKINQELLISSSMMNHRGQTQEFKVGEKTIYLRDESYNANPDTVINLIEASKKYHGQKLLVLGEMLELGYFADIKHEELADHLIDCPSHTLILVSGSMKMLYHKLDAMGFAKNNLHFFENIDDAVNAINQMDITAFDFIGGKGSRGVKTEIALEAITGILKNSAE